MVKILRKFIQWKKPRTLKGGESGFSIIETLVAVSIASMVLGGFASSVVISLRGYQSGKQSFIAAKIAQEGMELAINKRDNNLECFIDPASCVISNWKDNLIGDFEVDVTDSSTLSPGQNFKTYDPNHYICTTSTGEYGYCSAGNQLRGDFTREVKISDINTNAIKVDVVVSWDKQTGGRRNVTLSEVLFGGT
jgi:Tfp pilus assembly protein PilV